MHWLALNDVGQCRLVSIDEVVGALSSVAGILAGTEANNQICWGTVWLLISLALEQELLRFEHAWSNKHFDARGLSLHGAAVEANHLSIVSDLFAGAAVELLEGDVEGDANILELWSTWLIQSTKSSSEDTTLKLGTCVITDIEEWVHSEEEVVKDLVAVVLVRVATSED